MIWLPSAIQSYVPGTFSLVPALLFIRIICKQSISLAKYSQSFALCEVSTGFLLSASLKTPAPEQKVQTSGWISHLEQNSKVKEVPVSLKQLWSLPHQKACPLQGYTCQEPRHCLPGQVRKGRAVKDNPPKPSGLSSHLAISLIQACGLISRFSGLEDAQSTVRGLIPSLFFTKWKKVWLQIPFVSFLPSPPSLLLLLLWIGLYCASKKKCFSDGLAFPWLLGAIREPVRGLLL